MTAFYSGKKAAFGVGQTWFTFLLCRGSESWASSFTPSSLPRLLNGDINIYLVEMCEIYNYVYKVHYTTPDR